MGVYSSAAKAYVKDNRPTGSMIELCKDLVASEHAMFEAMIELDFREAYVDKGYTTITEAEDSENKEKTTVGIIGKIKELVTKFINWVKNFISGFIKKIKEFFFGKEGGEGTGNAELIKQLENVISNWNGLAGDNEIEVITSNNLDLNNRFTFKTDPKNLMNSDYSEDKMNELLSDNGVLFDKKELSELDIDKDVFKLETKKVSELDKQFVGNLLVILKNVSEIEKSMKKAGDERIKEIQELQYAVSINDKDDENYRKKANFNFKLLLKYEQLVSGKIIPTEATIVKKYLERVRKTAIAIIAAHKAKIAEDKKPKEEKDNSKEKENTEASASATESYLDTLYTLSDIVVENCFDW